MARPSPVTEMSWPPLVLILGKNGMVLFNHATTTFAKLLIEAIFAFATTSDQRR